MGSSLVLLSMNIISDSALLFLLLPVSLEWLRLPMGPGVGPVPCFPGPRHRAPDWTQLLPQQDISGGNATAQDIFTDFLRFQEVASGRF
jgi:hypothetical protein